MTELSSVANKEQKLETSMQGRLPPSILTESDLSNGTYRNCPMLA